MYSHLHDHSHFISSYFHFNIDMIDIAVVLPTNRIQWAKHSFYVGDAVLLDIHDLPQVGLFLLIVSLIGFRKRIHGVQHCLKVW